MRKYWSIDEILDVNYYKEQNQLLDDITQIELINPVFDVSKIPDIVVSNKQNNCFRPQTWTEYIGQEQAKSILQSYIAGINKRNTILPHVLIDGHAGFGKTALAGIIKNELKAKLISHIATEIEEPEQLILILKDINLSTEKNVILFIDEVHAFSAKLIEIFYPILEDFQIGNKNIKPFTFIGATTEKGQLLRKFKPFVDRFKLQLTLQDYDISEITTIMTQYKERLFSDINIPGDIFNCLAKNSRLTPRFANRIVEAYCYIGELEKTLNAFNIVDNERGLTVIDFKILNYLSKNNKVGIQGICSFLDTSQENYLYQYEPYLIRLGLIIRTPRGRQISEDGIKILTERKD